MWECEGESGGARVRVCVFVVSQVSNLGRGIPFMCILLITIIASHHPHHWFDQYLDIQTCAHIYVCDACFGGAPNAISEKQLFSEVRSNCRV